MAKRKIRTISIAPDLSAKLDRFSQENWSAIACRAFEIRLKELEVMNATDAEERAVARMKASKLKATDSMYRDGEVAGTTYVLREAEFAEMERLEMWRDRLGSDRDAVLDQLTFRQLARVMTANDGTDDDIEKEMRENHGNDIDQESWLAGFIDGALEKFDQLRDKLD